MRPTVRTIRWGGLLGSIFPAAFIVWHFRNETFPSAPSSAFGLRLAALSLALGLAFVLDDPTEDTLGYTPVSVLTRRAVRVGLTLPPAILFWLALRAYAAGGLAPDARLPAWPFVIEFLAFAAVALAGAAVTSRLVSDKLGGPGGAGAVVLVAVTVALLPWANGLWTRTPGTRSSDASTLWWWTILGIAAFAWWRSSVTPGLLSWRVRGGRSSLSPHR